ncbi:ferredoxin--NADP reductase [bacterium]|nr:ferredoxin--NADP reductase [Rubripirellula sp.]MDB4338937.1 ferredoxin--NADP reductase [Rubripirellula sp.]MDB4676601.1 ferredoxin--NADP reductase [bacterium]
MSDTIDSTTIDSDEADRLREKFYNATIVERIDKNPDLARFRVQPDHPIPDFEPGQYVALGLGNWEPRLDGTQNEVVPEKRIRKLSRRAYSISCPMLGSDGQVATVDSVDYLEFYVTLVRQASSAENKPPVLTPRLFCLAAGDRIEVQKKITGQYTLSDLGPRDTVLMLGTGTGEAPHNAMAAKLLAQGHLGQIVNVTSVRHRADLAYTREHEILMERYSQYRYLPYTTRDPQNLDSSRPDFVGKQYIQDLFKSGDLAEAAGVEFSPSNTHVFLCGNPAMIGYVPPGGQPLASPGMLSILRDVGYRDNTEVQGPGSIRFEKYW